MNLIYAARIIEFVRSHGVVDFCLCAGARNSPLITLLDENKPIIEQTGRLYHFFDERSAGFFALGRAQKSQRPVAIITTSGTATTELISSAVEAYYTQTPLIFITADRPPAYRKSGAPQAIEQIGIFSHYALPTIDLHESENGFNDSLLQSLLWDKKIPLHLNLCFNEPLLSGNVPKLNDRYLENPQVSIKNISVKSESQKKNAENKIEFFNHSKRPLFIISGLNTEDREHVLSTLHDFPGNWWIETLSGLRGHPALEMGRIQCGDIFLQHQLSKKKFDGVIRIGSVPTLRLWRDLEDQFKHLPVLNISSSPWSGLARPSERLPLEDLFQVCEHYQTQSIYNQNLIHFDRDYYKSYINLLEKHPRSELNLVRQLSHLVGEQPLYLGNSLPIREWDIAAKPFLLSSPSGNRGANGIDGQLSTFFGWKSEQKHSWALVGDLTALYDLNAPWILPQLTNSPWTLAIMNNLGGQIFKPMFQREAFLNRHNLNFEDWSRMWNLKYEKMETLPTSLAAPPSILEVIPSEEETQQLGLEIKKLWKTL